MITVIICDDNKPIADRIANTVPWDQLGCRVAAVCYDGYSGKKAIASFLPELIISDIRMPNLSGLEMIELSRNLIPDTRIIFISAYNEFEYAYSAIKLNAVDYLLKPFTQKDLLEAINKAILSVQAERKNRLQNEEPAPKAVSKGTGTKELALSYLSEHIGDNVTLDKLASLLHVNATHLGRILKQETGMRFTDFYTQMRIDRAKALLLDTDYRVNEIAEMVGYKNYLTFYKAFCKVEKISPTEYLRKLGKGVKNHEAEVQADSGND